ncbi:MAG: hypothetical protein ACLFWL_07670 [Candidatus Brocadiia bacterium]
MKRSLVMGCLIGVVLTGCYSPPFEQTELVSVENVSPETVSWNFQQQIAPAFESEERLVFRVFLGWKKIAVLGLTRLDREDRTLEALCLNHLGVSLFHIKGTPDETKLRYGLPEFKKHKKFPLAVGTDIRRICFDLVPAENAKVIAKPKRIIFRQKQDGGILEYVFGGPNVLLLEKRFFNKCFFGRKLRWKVQYFEYQEKDDYVYPRGIVLYNRKNHYRLIAQRRKIIFDTERAQNREAQP